jgi:hypothetical protein
VVDINVDAVVHVYPPGHDRRPILRDFINNVRDKLVSGGFIGREEIEKDMAALERHLSNPEVLVTSHTFFRLNGRLRCRMDRDHRQRNQAGWATAQ